MSIESGFLAGFGCGLTLLLGSALRPVSPPWLRRLLTGLLLVQAVFYMLPSRPLQALAWAGLLLCSIFAVDQLIRHPAMSPRQLLRFSIPLPVYAMAVGWTAWPPLAIPVLGGIGFVAWVATLLPKIPNRAMQVALVLLAAAHALQAAAALSPVSLRPDLLLLLALWHTYDLAYRLNTNR